MSQLVTIEDLQNALPNRKNAITPEIVDIINKSQSEPEFQGESLFQTASTYESVLKGTKHSIKDYLNAVRFCAYLVSQDDNYTEAYKKTFSERDFVKERLMVPTDSPKYTELTSAASRYRRSKLVVDLLTISQVPLHMMFNGWQYEAIGVLHDTMHSAKLDRDKINAAKELLAATKGPDNVKIELDVGVGTTTLQEDLNRQLALLAANQKQMLEAGISIHDAQKLNINLDKEEEAIEGEFVDVK